MAGHRCIFMKVSILVPYYNRINVVERTMWLLTRQDYPNYEIIWVDDGSEEEHDVKGFVTIFDMVRYDRIRDAKNAPIREANKAWRRGFEMAEGDFIIITHPEILVPLNAVRLSVEEYEEGLIKVPTLYFICDNEMMLFLDDLPWKENLDSIQSIPHFWARFTPWGNLNSAMVGWSGHTAFCGLPRSLWEKMGFPPEKERTGSDVRFLNDRRIALGLKNKFNSFAVYHQEHYRIQGSEKSYQVRLAQLQLHMATENGSVREIRKARKQLDKLEADERHYWDNKTREKIAEIKSVPIRLSNIEEVDQ